MAWWKTVNFLFDEYLIKEDISKLMKLLFLWLVSHKSAEINCNLAQHMYLNYRSRCIEQYVYKMMELCHMSILREKILQRQFWSSFVLIKHEVWTLGVYWQQSKHLRPLTKHTLTESQSFIVMRHSTIPVDITGSFVITFECPALRRFTVKMSPKLKFTVWVHSIGLHGQSHILLM